jgi:hypothetical protein
VLQGDVSQLVSRQLVKERTGAHRHAGYGVIDDGRERSTRLLWWLRKKVTRRVTNTNRVTRTISLTVMPHNQQHESSRTSAARRAQPSTGHLA